MAKAAFFKDTLGSLIPRLLYYQLEIPAGLNLAISTAVAFFVFLIFGLILLGILGKNKELIYKHQELFFFNLTILLIWLGSTLQFYLLGTDYLMERFALFLYPLFVLNVAFFLNYLLEIKKLNAISAVFAFILMLLACINVQTNLNSRYYLDWKYDMETKNAFWTMKKNHELNAEDPCQEISLGVNWLFEPTMAYYRFKNQFFSLRQVDRKGLKANQDYHYAFQNELPSSGDTQRASLLDAKEIGSVLILNKN